MIIRSKLITGLLSWVFPVAGVVIFPFIIINPEYESKRLINHERIHWCQWFECFVIGFPIIYIATFLWHFAHQIKKKKPFKKAWFDAYTLIPFEKEAWTHENDLSYTSRRKSYAWLGVT